MPEFIAKQTHFNNLLGREVKAGEPVEVPVEHAEANKLLFEAVAKRGGRPPLEELLNLAIQKNLGKEEELRKLPYAELAALVKSKE